MNTITKMGIAALVATTSTFAFETWLGSNGLERVNTGFDNGTGTSGYWWDYSDWADGGESKITWPVEKGNGYEGGEESLEPIVKYCKGLCGTYTLSKGTLTYNPFVGVGFNVAGESEGGGNPTAVDATSMGGICIGYSVDDNMIIEMDFGDAVDKELGYDNPATTAAKSPSGTVKTFPWNKFYIGGYGCPSCNGEEFANRLVSLKFKIQGADGTTGNFNIMSVGPYDGECKINSTEAIGSSVAKASLKAQLSGRILSFGNTVAKVEIINLQGQVVMAASSVKTMDLSKVQAGIYMVHADGLSQKIQVK